MSAAVSSSLTQIFVYSVKHLGDGKVPTLTSSSNVGTETPQNIAASALRKAIGSTSDFLWVFAILSQPLFFGAGVGSTYIKFYKISQVPPVQASSWDALVVSSISNSGRRAQFTDAGN